MRKLILERTDLSVSRFGFGTSRLFNVRTARQRERLLAAAYEAGITHFDTAPLYGFGVAESELKPFLKAHPDATVATKVGLYAPGGEDQAPLSVFVRKTAGRVMPSFSRAIADWGVARAKRSLEASLRRLGRERVNLYLLHEPEAHLFACDEWLSWLESESDRVQYFGIACNAARLPGFLESNNPFTRVVQCPDSLADREADILLSKGRRMQITYGYISKALSRNEDVELTLVAALRRNTAGCVLVSSSKLERMQRFAVLAELADSEVPPTESR